MISEAMKNRLMAIGLNKNQVNSPTADAIINYLMSDDGKILIQEAYSQVDEAKTLVENMRDTLSDLRAQYYQLQQKIDTVAGVILDIAKAQEEYGTLTDEKARNAVTLYASILNMNDRAGAKGTESVNNAGYVTYAYLGGQARRDVRYEKPQFPQNEDN